MVPQQEKGGLSRTGTTAPRKADRCGLTSGAERSGFSLWDSTGADAKTAKDEKQSLTRRTEELLTLYADIGRRLDHPIRAGAQDGHLKRTGSPDTVEVENQQRA